MTIMATRLCEENRMYTLPAGSCWPTSAISPEGKTNTVGRGGERDKTVIGAKMPTHLEDCNCENEKSKNGFHTITTKATSYPACRRPQRQECLLSVKGLKNKRE